MFAELALRTHRRSDRAPRAAHRPQRLLSYSELDTVVARVITEHFAGPVALLSVARADDGAYVVIECGMNALPEEALLKGAAQAVSSTLDPAALDLAPGADIRVRFSEVALAR